MNKKKFGVYLPLSAMFETQCIELYLYILSIFLFGRRRRYKNIAQTERNLIKYSYLAEMKNNTK